MLLVVLMKTEQGLTDSEMGKQLGRPARILGYHFITVFERAGSPCR
jgi:hypothetical protein